MTNEYFGQDKGPSGPVPVFYKARKDGKFMVDDDGYRVSRTTT